MEPPFRITMFVASPEDLLKDALRDPNVALTSELRRSYLDSSGYLEERPEWDKIILMAGWRWLMLVHVGDNWLMLLIQYHISGNSPIYDSWDCFLGPVYNHCNAMIMASVLSQNTPIYNWLSAENCGNMGETLLIFADFHGTKNRHVSWVTCFRVPCPFVWEMGKSSSNLAVFWSRSWRGWTDDDVMGFLRSELRGFCGFSAGFESYGIIRRHESSDFSPFSSSWWVHFSMGISHVGHVEVQERPHDLGFSWGFLVPKLLFIFMGMMMMMMMMIMALPTRKDGITSGTTALHQEWSVGWDRKTSRISVKLHILLGLLEWEEGNLQELSGIWHNSMHPKLDANHSFHNQKWGTFGQPASNFDWFWFKCKWR